MEPFVFAFLGGLFGALLMDITETYAARVGVSSGGGVALLYPLLFTSLFSLPAGLAPIHHLVGGLLFGLATSVLPWFVLLPCFGWGL